MLENEWLKKWEAYMNYLFQKWGDSLPSRPALTIFDAAIGLPLKSYSFT